ncbi:hypothetical protein SDJN02_23058, partial [Cucurbita argyrosperma subsp. argyrosperma]
MAMAAGVCFCSSNDFDFPVEIRSEFGRILIQYYRLSLFKCPSYFTLPIGSASLICKFLRTSTRISELRQNS